MRRGPQDVDNHFRPDIEGLRALAVLLVVTFHLGIERLFANFGLVMFRGGFVGVDVFYVISGFLITGLLLREAESSGKVSLKRFYSRRARRLLPASAIVLISTLIGSWLILPALEWPEVASDAFSASAYFSNIRFASQATNYFAHGISKSPVLQYWSLSLEEQFYLVWPTVFVVVLLWKPGRFSLRQRLLPVVLVGALTSFTASIVLTRVYKPWAYFGLPSRAWELGVGALLAIAAPRLRNLDPRIASAGGVVGLAMILAAAAFLGGAVPFPGWIAAVPVIGSALILGAGIVHPHGSVSKALSFRPATYVGRISYPWYLWHWPFITFAESITGKAHASGSVALLAGGLSLAAAAMTHALVEEPARRSQWILTRWRPLGLVTGSVGIVSVLGLALVVSAYAGGTGPTTPLGARRDVPRSGLGKDGYGCTVRYGVIQPSTCFREGADGLTIAVIGDSHADHFAPAFRKIAREKSWRILVFAWGSCPPFDVRTWRRAYSRVNTECSNWRASIQSQLEEIRPDMIVLSRYGGYADDLVNRMGIRALPIEVASLWRAGARSAFIRLSSITRNVVVIRDTPRPGVDVPACLSTNKDAPSRCDFPLIGHARWDKDLFMAEKQAAKGIPSVSFIDITNAICPSDPCRVVAPSGLIKYRDRSHLAATYSRSLAPALIRLLDEVRTRG